MTDQQFTIEELNSEEWKLIPGFESRYEISNLGRLRSLSYHGRSRIKILSPSPNTKGYVICCLYEHGKPHSIGVHILVARAFCVQKRPDQIQVNHIDLNKTNNRAQNLEWNTPKEDGEHRARTGAAARGDRHGTKTKPHTVKRGNKHWSKIKPEHIVRGSKQGSAKINELIVQQMRQRYAEVRSYVQVAREFKMSESQTIRIIKRQGWSHVD